jgi:hypothetical protein
MSDNRWRTRLRWVVVHPHDPAVLLARRDGVLALPETERPGQVWTADPAEVLPALGELLGADALLLDCLDDHQDPAARVQRATLLAVWFKANTTSPLVVNEGVVMGALAGLFPGQVPAPPAVEPEQGLDGAGRPGVTNGTGGRCRTAQSGRRPPPPTAGRCTAERWGRWSWTRPRPRCRS